MRSAGSGYRGSIIVRVAPEVAFAHWERIEQLPRFIASLREVTGIDPRHSRWRAQIAGVEREWLAELTERVPGQRLAWVSRRGARHAGSVTFLRAGGGATRVVLECTFEPDGLLDAAGDLLRLPQRSLDQALESFKRHVERSIGLPTDEHHALVAVTAPDTCSASAALPVAPAHGQPA
jgi:uncharacterized membrane protein